MTGGGPSDGSVRSASRRRTRFARWPTRATLDGKHPNGWVPEQKIAIADAVAAYTRAAAFAEFQERDKGTIARGKLADLVILTDDVLTIPAPQIKDVRVLTTIVGGKVVYQRRP